MNRIFLILLTSIVSTISFSQVIGGRENSESTPKVAEATELSGGGFVGDVNVMTGEFQASIPLGSVSTPVGLGFSLSLNHSSSFAFSNNQPMTAGIPYGDGWSLGLPTISIETDVFRKYSCGQLQTYGGVTPSDSILKFHEGQYTGSDEGDLYWFSPMVSIPGVVSGRAVFKYVDVDDERCLVFVLNKFETSVEIRYYGNSWTVRLADGTKYNFSTHLANYRAPSNQRVLFYDQSNLVGANVNQSVAANSHYSSHASAVQNVIEPKQTYSVWHCDLIYNQNTPLQGVRFNYEKFGEFDYFQEFSQAHYQGVRTDVFQTSTDTDYTAYSDLFLQKVYSYVMESPLDIVELDYATVKSLADNNTMLLHDHPDNVRKDSLYNYTVVKEWGEGTGDFDNWHRAKHWAAYTDPAGSVNSTNPYLSPAGGYYNWEDGPNDDEMPFDHGFLYSPRVLDGVDLYPGDVYEIRTTITRPDGGDKKNGNGTLDISITTGDLGNHPGDESNTYSYPWPTQTSGDYENQNGVEIFSTFNSAMKWQMGFGQGTLNTSNFFVMPNIPSTYHGMNIQIGPGNSDIDFGADTGPNYGLLNSSTSSLDVRQAYPFNTNGGRLIKSTASIPHNFGTGHPWGMMIPVYDDIALVDPWLVNSQPQPHLLYDTWWKRATDGHENIPTKFDETVKLKKVELIRYSKNPYMLTGVKVYKVNGDYVGMPDGTANGLELVAQKTLHYDWENENLIRNYDYDDGDLLHVENYNRRVVLLTEVREIPVDISVNVNYYATDYNLTNVTEFLTTFLEYRKIFDNDGLANGITYDHTKPYNGLSQYLLYSYTDHLGGVTKVDYYPFGGNGESRWSSNYVFSPCNINITRRAIGRTNSYTGHAAVQYLAKNDENDIILNTNFLGSGNANIKVWEYQYDVTKTIFNPKQMDLNQAHFRSQYLFRNEVAFGEVRVISPVLPNGEYTYIDYEYYGHDDPLTTPSEQDFLLYGKLKTMKTYDQNDVLHEEKIIEYDYTLAFENAYIRPNLLREKLGYDDHYARSYEYEDVYKDEELHLYNVIYYYDNSTPPVLIDSLVTIDAFGQAAYPDIDVPILHGNYDDREQPRFLEFWFYNDLITENEIFFFDSYFVKKTSEINRVYDDYLGKNGGTSNPSTPITVWNSKDPFGSGIINTVPDDPITDDPLMLTINESSSSVARDALLANSPLSDTVLNHAISSFMKQDHITTVLVAQTGLSNKVWNHFIDNKGKFSTQSYDLMISAQPYFSDDIQSHLIQSLTIRDNYDFPRDLLLKNNYLSDDIILEMTNSANIFPEEVFSRVISEQSYLIESTLQTIINCVHVNNNTLVDILSDQVLNDVLWDDILLNPNFDTRTLTQLVENAIAFPSDNTLIDILDHSPAFTSDEVDRIFAIMNRPIGETVEVKLLTNYPEIGPHIASKPFTGNPLDQYCNNAIVGGRTYIETRTDYEYYEADYTGKSIGKGYEMLLGHRSTVDDPSPYPFTQTTTMETGVVVTHDVANLRLKHEPSWQVYAIQTSSPQNPEAYTREEYYYLYDLQNRYDRYWYNYDLSSNDYAITDFDPLNGLFSKDTIGFNWNWDTEYTDLSYPKLPQFDGMERARTYGNRSLAFQKSVISKNSRDEAPLIRSEYYDYDRRWIFNDLPGEIETVEHDMGPCQTGGSGNSGGNGGPCQSIYDCTDCYSFKYTTDEQMQTLVPMGHCAYLSPTIGWFICPYGTDVTSYVPDAFAQYCNMGVSSSNSPVVNPLIIATPKALPFADALAKTLLLRSVTVQVDTLDHSASQDFIGIKMDEKNQYIAEFELGNFADVDANNFNAPYEMIYPYDHLTVRTIAERNRYLQPVLEENQVGLQTKYYYNKSNSLWNINVNCNGTGSSGGQSYSSHLNEDIGKPIRITVGYNKVDSLSSTYEYNDISLANKVMSPSGKFMEYTFDNYFRLTSTKENNTRLLTEIEYSNWLHDNVLGFEDRTKENYVETTTYNDVPALNTLGTNEERRKAFIDPLGRNHSVASGYSTDEFNHVEIHSGTVEYDNWGRIVKAFKNFRVDLTTPTAGAPKILLNENTINPFAETVFENDPKGRALRTSNYGVAVAGIHAVKSSYAITNNIYTSCELDLNQNELELIMGPGGTGAYRFMRTEVLDQDNKQSVEYINALGQKVASLKYNDNNQRIVTLFVYDSYGNLSQVINPEKKNTHYEYNILGQLVKETTVDAGIKRYMYNKQGLVSITLDEQGQFYDPNGNGVPGNHLEGTVDAFYRVYNYDDYGRVIKVGRIGVPYDYSLNQEIPFLQYKTALIGEDVPNGIPENGDTGPNARYLNYVYSNASSQDWLASFDAWAMQPVGNTGTFQAQVTTISGFENLYMNTLEKETFYGGDVTSNEIGKVVKTHSYDNDGLKILKTEYTYDDYDNLATQITTFNPNLNVDLNDPTNLTSTIDYPAYNYRNSLKEQTVDVDNDGTVDYHCFMEYDALNRLKAIHGAAGFASDISSASLLVSYEYDDANGLVDKKKHFIDDDNGLSVLANEIDYNYDVRDRLTEINAGLSGFNPMMHYELFYDDNQLPSYNNGGVTAVVASSSNWNGNINGTTMNYALEEANIANPITNYDQALLYSYNYDKLNRLVNADGLVGNYIEATDLSERLSIGDVSIDYDRIGNIKSLHRTLAGQDIQVMNPVLPLSDIQHWNYMYFGATNRLTQVVGQGTTATRSYSYDANGNLLTDDSKNMISTEYGRAAYPFHIQQVDQAETTDISYLYSSTDLRIYKKSVLSEEIPEVGTVITETTYDYYLMDGMGKTVAIFHSRDNGSLDEYWEYFASGSERECRLNDKDGDGSFRNTTDLSGIPVMEVDFYLYDHLGNTRVNYSPMAVITHAGDPAEIEQTINSVVDFYPYGKVLREFVNGDQERYLTTQHERDQETGLDYRGARYYDSDIGRFLSLDPHAKDYPSLADFVYVANNPVMLVDPDGKDPKESKSKTKTKNAPGDTRVELPSHAEITGVFIDEDGNGEINYGKKTLDATDGDVRSFTVNGTGFLARFDEDGDFNGFWDAKGNKYHIANYPEHTVEEFEFDWERNFNSLGGTGKSLVVLGPLTGLSPATVIGGVLTLSHDANAQVEEYLNENYTPSQRKKTQDFHRRTVGTVGDDMTNDRCFVRGTLVNTPKGYVPIESLSPGDLVYSYNLDTDSIEISEVIINHKRISDHICYLDFGGTEVKVTNEHPFYLIDKGWTSVNEIKLGDKVLTQDGAVKSLTNKTKLSESTEVYNLSVSNNKNYFVTDVKLLVHNKECFIGASQVVLENGTTVRIDDLKIGSKIRVLSDSSDYCEVEQINRVFHSRLVQITLESGNRITTTFDHPILLADSCWAAYDNNETLRDLGVNVANYSIGSQLFAYHNESQTFNIDTIVDIKLIHEGQYTYHLIINSSPYIVNGIIAHPEGSEENVKNYYISFKSK